LGNLLSQRVLRRSEEFEYSILRAIRLLDFVKVITFHTASGMKASSRRQG